MIDDFSFEFGVSLNEIEFVQNIDNDFFNEDVVMLVLKQLMEDNKFETENKTYGVVIHENRVFHVLTRPYVDDWCWDFDHPDTIETKIVWN